MTQQDASFFEAYITHPGAVRPENEDSFLARAAEGLWAVADGMGGLENGRWASRVVAEALAGTPLSGDLEGDANAVSESIHLANQRIFKESVDRRIRMGSTVVALLVTGGRFAVLWAGDSRAYLWRRDQLVALTRDHTQVRQMVESGYLTAEEGEHHAMAHVLARAVGVQAQVELDSVAGELEAGDLFVLCSDGLSTVLTDAEIAGQLAHATPSMMTERLLELSLAREAPDNVTILAVGCGQSLDAAMALGRSVEATGAPSPVLGGAAADESSSKIDEVVVVEVESQPQRKRSLAPMFALAAIAALVVGGGALAYHLMRGGSHGPVAASVAAGPGGQAAAEEKARRVFEATLGAIPCSWVDLQKVAAGPAGFELALSGVAAAPVAVQGALAQAAASSKLPVADVDLQAVAPASAALCPTLDVIRPFRAATSETGHNLSAAQDAFAIMKQADDKLAGRAILTLTLPPPPTDFALVQLGSAGDLTVLAPSREAFAALATAGGAVTKLPQPNSYRVQADYGQTGLSSLILLTGKGPFPPAVAAPASAARGADWSNQFAAAARAGGWRAEMAWYRIAEAQPTAGGAPPSMVPPTMAPPSVAPPPPPTTMSPTIAAPSASPHRAAPSTGPSSTTAPSPKRTQTSPRPSTSASPSSASGPHGGSSAPPGMSGLL